MNTTSQYKDLSEFLAKHNAKEEKNVPITHTRIGSKDLNVYGGSYIIPKEDLETFYHLYYDHIFIKKKKEYLTEVQLNNGSEPLLVDLDFRYNYDVETRQHTKEHIQDIICLYLEELKEFFIFEENKAFDVFIFEKPTVNRVKEDNITKDGIHILIGIQIDHTMQMMIRDRILSKIGDTCDLPLINTWDSVLDKGISKGTTNWQLFGSRKPGNDAYELSEHWVITYDKTDKEFMMDERSVQEFDLKNNYKKLSAQYDNNVKFELNPKIMDDYNKNLESSAKKIKRPNSKIKVNLLIEDEGENGDEEFIPLEQIKDKNTLEKAVNIMLTKLKPDDYDIKETHLFTQILPEKYYEPGSHLLNRQVAFALKRTDERLFLSWVQLRSKASDFDYDTIPQLYHDWKKYFNVSGDSKYGVTKRSIMYWAKQDAFEEYEEIKKQTVDYFMEEAIQTQTEFDLAQVLHRMFKDRYVCISYDKKGTWFIFKEHRWQPDNGVSLRLAISKDMYNLFGNKRERYNAEYLHYSEDDERREYLTKKCGTISKLMTNLKRTNDKNNIMREAMELFYDKDFVTSMDTNKYLLCFNNGVVDFQNKTFRDGYPQDYITKTTGIDYKEYNQDDKHMSKIGEELIVFMEKLFPIPQLCQYMWNHLASCLIGTNKNQTFNVYHGSGSNGKSMITDLMAHTLGQYKGTVPITLVTEKRGLIGGTSDEVLKLKGVRYAVMQEPSKGVKLNEGIMKELTGGDPIQARGLFKESEIFKPQFKLVVCTNNLFDIESNDDGTWRRIRKCNFLSKFIDENDTNKYESEYIYPKDKTLEERLPILAPVFASMLVKRAFITEGVVEDCEYVLEESNKYRKGQDHIAAFVSENILRTNVETDRIRKTQLASQFKFWFQQEQGNKKMPKGQELYEYMDKKFGPHKSTGWYGVKIIQAENENTELSDVDN